MRKPKKPGDNISKMNDKKKGKMKSEKKDGKKSMKKKGKGILKALGEKKATGNFKKIEKAKGKGAAIGALINKLDKKRGKKPRYAGKKK